MARSIFVPFGRLSDLRARPDADRMAYTPGRSWDSDYKVTIYASRAALEAFCRDGGAHHALVKTPTPRNMLTNRNTQSVVQSDCPVSPCPEVLA